MLMKVVEPIRANCAGDHLGREQAHGVVVQRDPDRHAERRREQVAAAGEKFLLVAQSRSSPMDGGPTFLGSGS
jgi:hypothetical protein